MHIEIFSKAAPRVITAATTQIRAQCNRVGVIVNFSPTPPANHERRIALVFVGDGSTWSASEEKSFKSLLDDGVIVLPIVEDPPTAQFLPKSLSHMNAFVMDFFGNAWAECLADEILGKVW